MRWVGAVAKAAAGLPHLSRKKGECASLSTVCADCDLRFLNFSSEVFWPPKFAYSRRRFFVYIYMKIYIYIYLFLFVTLATGCFRTSSLRSVDACPLVFS